ncbi:glutathione peroxidase [Vagococcus elongatus]|uniref:Glutathione peroxidase n=1 Tax=Vagococcus elongatus TaxID=180344 RepID=A0A430AZS1_9ENTE|nr:glutathione peroxidase [Vagococcus elongatus]RSU13565.1 glutathione peroxidase [Vagococcus elongatus]
MSIYDFEVRLDDGRVYALSEYQDKVMLIVNTATKCGLAPQFKELESLYEKYQEDGLVILGFPSDQFKQELKTGSEAAEACRLKYGVSFPMHELIKVNGAETLPLFKYLKEQAPSKLGKTIKWNFTKFLVARQEQEIKRYSPQTTPSEIEKDIVEWLDKK